MDWRPTATREALVERAAMLDRSRAWFSRRGVLEVQTPLLSRFANSDPQIESFSVAGEPPRYLHTSPEAAMKRLVAAGYGDVYQIAPVFRQGEVGALHNPEFTLIEWYRVGWSMVKLIAEVEELIAELLELDGALPHTRHRYDQILSTVLTTDTATATLDELRVALAEWEVELPADADREAALDLAMATLVAPQLGHDGPAFVTHHPAFQTAQAEPDPSSPAHAMRFECYLGGREIANGYEERVDAAGLAEAFREDGRRRAAAGLPLRPEDPRLMAAVEHGLPPCSGVALGLDRLLMHKLGAEDVREVMTFGWEQA